MRFQAITQIVLVLLSIIMIVTIVRPLFAGIAADQAEITRFKDAVNAADKFNAQLDSLAARANSFSVQQLNALETYLPATVDTLAVSRDIVAIAEQNQLLVQSVTTTEVPVEVVTQNGAAGDPALMEPQTLGEEAERNVVTSRFTLEATGTYDQMKRALADYERNIYPLRLVSLAFTTDAETSILTFSAVFETYALNFE
jgi:hypothetical protein